MNTYGKTWHTDLDKNLPLGVPQLVTGITADDQNNPKLVSDRDSRFGVSRAEKQRMRADIVAPTIDAGADAWRTGEVIQVEDPTVRAHKH